MVFTKGAFRGPGAWRNVLMAALIILLPGSVLCSEAGLLQGVSFDRVFWTAVRWLGDLLTLAVLLVALSRYRSTRIPLFQWLAWAAGLSLVVTLYHMAIEAIFPLPYPPASLPSQPEWLPYAQVIPQLVAILIVPLLYVLAVENYPDRRSPAEVFGRYWLMLSVLMAGAIATTILVFDPSVSRLSLVVQLLFWLPFAVSILVLAYASFRAYRRYQELNLPFLKWLAIAFAIPVLARAFSAVAMGLVGLTIFSSLASISNWINLFGVQLLFPALLVYAVILYTPQNDVSQPSL